MPRSRSASTWSERIAVVLGVGAVAAAGATVLLPRAIPAADAAGQILAAAVHASPERYEGLYAPNHALSTQGFVEVTAALTGPLGGVVAAKLVLVVALVVLVGSLGLLARASGRSVGAALALGAAGFVGWPYAMGYFSFLLALTACAAASALLAVAPRSLAASIAAASACLVAAWLHAGGALAGGVLVALAVVHGRQRGAGSLRSLTVLVPSLTWSVYVALRWTGSDTATLLDALPPQWAPGEVVGMLPGAAGAAYTRLAVVPGVVTLGAVLAGAVRGDDVRGGRAALVAVLAVLIAVFAVPLHGGGFWFVSLSLAVVAFALLPAVSVPRGVAGALVACAALVATAYGIPNARYEGERIAAIVDRFPVDASLGRAYAVVYHPEPGVRMAAGVVPSAGTPLYAAVASAAWLPGAPAGSSPLHALRFAGGAPLLPDPADPYRVWSRACLAEASCAGSELAQADQIAVSAAAWDTVVLAGAPRAVIERLLARGLAPVLDSRLVLRAAASAVRFTFDVPGIAAASTLVLRASYPETIGVFRTVTSAPGVEDGEQVTLRLDNLPGGPVMVEAFADRDGDGEPGGGDYVFVRPRDVNLQAGAALTLRADSTLGGPRP